MSCLTLIGGRTSRSCFSMTGSCTPIRIVYRRGTHSNSGCHPPLAELAQQCPCNSRRWNPTWKNLSRAARRLGVSWYPRDRWTPGLTEPATNHVNLPETSALSNRCLGKPNQDRFQVAPPARCTNFCDQQEPLSLRTTIKVHTTRPTVAEIAGASNRGLIGGKKTKGTVGVESGSFV
jgi:hypothetical protein